MTYYNCFDKIKKSYNSREKEKIMARKKSKNTSRIVNRDVMAIILNMAIRQGSRSALGVYVGGSRCLLTSWEKGYAFPSPAAQAALITLSNGELEPEDFMGLPIHVHQSESMYQFIVRTIIEPRAQRLNIHIGEYMDLYLTDAIKVIISKDWLAKSDLGILTHAFYNDRSFWLKVYRRFISKQKVYDRNTRQFIETQELEDNVPIRDYTAHL